MRKKKQKGTPDGLEQAVSGEEEQVLKLKLRYFGHLM